MITGGKELQGIAKNVCIYCRVLPQQGLLVFGGVRTLVEGLDAWSSHNANEASNLCELVTQDHQER